MVDIFVTVRESLVEKDREERRRTVGKRAYTRLWAGILLNLSLNALFSPAPPLLICVAF